MKEKGWKDARHSDRFRRDIKSAMILQAWKEVPNVGDISGSLGTYLNITLRAWA